MLIGELAKETGVNPKTIRFYEEIGLMPTPDRTPSGYRQFSDDDLERLRFIRSAQRLNLRLTEIQEILALRERGERPCGYVLALMKQQVDEIDRKIEEMAQLRNQLIELSSYADLPPSNAKYCQLVEHEKRSHNFAKPS